MGGWLQTYVAERELLEDERGDQDCKTGGL